MNTGFEKIGGKIVGYRRNKRWNRFRWWMADPGGREIGRAGKYVKIQRA